MVVRIAAAAALAVVLGTLIVRAAAPAEQPAPAPTPVTDASLDLRFADTVRPFLENYCFNCHSGKKAEAQLDLRRFKTMADVAADHPHWAAVLEKLRAKEMPPKDAEEHPTDEARGQVIDWITSMRTHEAKKHAGDPGIVLARRLSNAEYNYTVRDLIGHDLRPTREFPVDPANPAGFDNTGESLAMSPALLTKYLQAAREVANHVVLKVDGSIAFAPHPMLVETDRDKYCITQIIDFYRAQNTDYGAYFHAAWRYKHRAALDVPGLSLADFAAEDGLSAKYLQTVWELLEGKDHEVGPVAKLRAMWRALPAPTTPIDHVYAECDVMRDWVLELRAKLEPRFPNLAAGSIKANAQPFLMWKNKQYAAHRRTFDRGALQVEGEPKPATTTTAPTTSEAGADNEFGPGRTQPVVNKPGDPDLVVPRGQRAPYEAAFERFCSVFPDAFYVEERGRNYLDKSKDRGRYLSAGFHNLMGYFRDDQPLYELILDEAGRKRLDRMWQELDFIASGNVRTFVQFYFNESGEARGTRRESEGPRPKDGEVTSEKMIREVEAAYLEKVGAENPVAVQAIKDHFNWVNDGIRWVERARIETQPMHLESLNKFAERAYRRPLTRDESDGLVAFYNDARTEAGLEHEDAMRDALVSVLMSPDFLYRIDLVPAGEGVRPLSDYALASRLSYFLWSSMPDEQLLASAAAGELRKPQVLAAQAKRMLRDDRARGLATEFGGNWLDFRRFEELNTVDRESFASFDNDLRSAMFEEPIRFMLDVFQKNGSVLDLIYADYTFMNPPLAKHYGVPLPDGWPKDEWVRTGKAREFGRGGLLPMAVFLTKNAPGQRTSPVKRGYWVVKRVLGEHIPPPPAAVPELPREEAKMEMPLRDALAKHREDASCMACHARFDSLGLVFEGYGPIGERRDKDLAGRPVDARATFPGNGGEGAGFDGLLAYVKQHREDDFVNSLSRSLLAYGLGRSLILSDEITIEQMREKLARDGYRFDSLIESIVTSPQFMNKRGGAQPSVARGESP